MLSSLLGAFTSVANNIYSNTQASEREARARQENYTYNELSAQNADKRTRALYNDLYSPQAQIEQLKEAGLSPSIYASNGIAGKSGVSGAMGNGASGISPNVFGINGVEAAQIANLMADTNKKKAETEGQNIANADDPVIARYISEKQQAITDANAKEAELTNKAFSDLQANLTTISQYSNSSNWTISHSEGQSESEANGWTISFNDAKGQSHSFNVGGSVSASLKRVGVSGNYGKSEGHNSAHGESKGQNSAKSWAQNVANAAGMGSSEGGYNRQAINVLETFYNQIAEISAKCQESRNEARDIYEFRVQRYEKNRKGK